MSDRRKPTPEVVLETTWRKVAVTIVVMVVGFVMVNVVASEYLRHNTVNYAYQLTDAKWRMIKEPSARCNTVVLGDSAAAHGFHPETWESVTGRTARNFAIVANLQAVNDAWMLEAYIEEHGAPANVLLVHTHDMWHRGWKSSLIGKIPQPWGFWSRREPGIDLSREQLWRIALARYLPIYAENRTLKRLLKGRSSSGRIQVEADGFLAANAPKRGTLRRDRHKTLRFLRQEKVKMTPTNVRSLQQIGKLARAHGFKVHLVEGPLDATIVGSQAYRTYSEKLCKKLKRAVRKYPEVIVDCRARAVTDDAKLQVVDHVREPGAVDYTRRLAADLAHQLAP